METVELNGEELIEEIRGLRPMDLSLDQIVRLYLCDDNALCVYMMLMVCGRDKRPMSREAIKHTMGFIKQVLYDINERFYTLWGTEELLTDLLHGNVLYMKRPDG